MMAAPTKTLFLQALEEWGRTPEALRGLTSSEQAAFLKQQGYASLRDLLAHVGAWWEEARIFVDAAVAKQPRPKRRHNFDEFNAAAVARFKDMPEAAFMTWYETQRQEMINVVSSLSDEQLNIRGVRGWLDGTILEHLKEHCVEAPRFLTIDALRREWADYVDRFNALSAEKQAAFLKKQGFARFRDLAAHIIAWWEQGIAMIEATANGVPCKDEDVDAFNAEAVARFGKLEESQVFADYEKTRLTLAGLIDGLPDQIYSEPNVQTWLKADVLEHYFEHPL
jgi:hypothetical protein